MFEKTPAPTETTGTEALRLHVQQLVKRMMYGRTAHEIGIHAETLRAFAEGRTTLPTDELVLLAQELYGGHATFDPVLDRLRPTNREPPRALCTAMPKPFVPTGFVGVGGPYRGGPQPVKPNPPQASKRRPGWIGDLF